MQQDRLSMDVDLSLSSFQFYPCHHAAARIKVEQEKFILNNKHGCVSRNKGLVLLLSLDLKNLNHKKATQFIDANHFHLSVVLKQSITLTRDSLQ
jgi:hypothetical protein